MHVKPIFLYDINPMDQRFQKLQNIELEKGLRVNLKVFQQYSFCFFFHVNLTVAFLFLFGVDEIRIAMELRFCWSDT